MHEIVDETCKVTCVENGNTVEAEMLDFFPNKLLSVSFERKVKLRLNWNGRVFEGRMGKLTFVSNGPNVRIVDIKG